MLKNPVFSFYTLGCRLNQAEEESLRRQVMERGFLISASEKADLCIVNTCSVTALADKKSRHAIRKLKIENCKLKVIVTGCGADSVKDVPEVDLIVPNKEKNKIVDFVLRKYKIANNKGQINYKNKKSNNKYRTRALLKVQDGCNNFCSYCIVPFLRGREVSVPTNDVIAEAKKLDEMGYKELVISGVNVGRYGEGRTLNKEMTVSQKGSTLEGLLEVLLKETEFPRIRLSSINPQDITEELIDLWANEERLCRHFHLSMQSGSNTVLTRMGRPYTADKYLELVDTIYRKIPEMAITTDIIVGFPGETDAEFGETLKTVRSAKLAKVHVFRYSNRKGTKAEKMTGQVSDEAKKQRAQELGALAKELNNDFIQKNIGSKMSVLFEYKRGDFWYGVTSNYIRIKYRSDENLYNQIREIDIKKENAC